MTLGPVLVAAGGTGGHLFPAEALAKELSARGIAVELVTDPRGKQYGGDFPARAVHEIPSATPSGGSLLARAKAVLTLLCRHCRGALADRPQTAGRRRRLRRLSECAACLRRDAAARADHPA